MQRPLRRSTKAPEPRAAPKTIIRRVTLPRFEVIYPSVAQARAVAGIIAQKKFLALDGDLDVAVGNQVVVDLAASGCAAAVTLLFRVIGKSNGTLLEWWARRETDTAALALWIEGLTPSSVTAAPDADKNQIVEMCQRALKRNPFDMLGVHWSAELPTLVAAGKALILGLTQASEGELEPKVAALVRQAHKTALGSLSRLNTQQGRVQARQTFVPGHQLRHARELLETQLEMAKVRGDRTEIGRIQEQRRELGF
jgi:hypothetical protein